MKFGIYAFAFISGVSPLFAAELSDILQYKSGESMAWYHELIRDAYKPEKQVEARDLVMSAVKDPNLSDEAFRLCCKILKMTADEKTASELAKFTESDVRSTSVFDVLISLESPKVDDILLDILKSSKSEGAKVQAAYALGMRECKGAIAALSALSNCRSKDLRDAAIIALGHIPSEASVGALKKFAKSKDSDKFLLNNALCELRESFMSAGNFKAARAIAIDEDFRPALLSEFYLNGKDKGVGEMDELIISNSENARNAATIANFGRTRKNSGKLIDSYKSLPDGAKVAAIRSFALTKDKSFLDLIRSDISDSGSPVSVEAIFACGFIGDKSVVPQLVELMDAKDKRTSNAAKYALTTMPVKDVDGILKSDYASSKNPKVLDVLLARGNLEFKAEMLNRFFDESEKNENQISGIVERHLGYGGLSDLWKKAPANDKAARKKAMRVFIKIVSKDREKPFRKAIVEETMAAANFDESELKLLESRLYAPKK